MMKIILNEYFPFSLPSITHLKIGFFPYVFWGGLLYLFQKLRISYLIFDVPEYLGEEK